MTAGPSPATGKADADLYHRLASLNGPLLSRLWKFEPRKCPQVGINTRKQQWGLDPALFGVHPKGEGEVAAPSLCVQAPSVIEVRIPADLVQGYELVTAGVLHPTGREKGSVQLRILARKPQRVPSREPGVSILVGENSAARKRLAADIETFRDLFPPALCYTKIVPVDEVVTLTLFYREDHQLDAPDARRHRAPPPRQALARA